MAETSSRPVIVLRGLAAAAFLVAVGVGVPVLLVTKVGWPLPRQLPAWTAVTEALARGEIPNRVWIGALAVIGWVVWAGVVIGVTVEAALAARGHVRAGEPAGMQRSLAHLVGAVVLAGLTLLQRPAPVGAAPPPLPPPVVTTVPAPEPAPPPPSPTPGPPERGAPDAPTWTVRRGDSLWHISAVTLGDPYRWRQIAARNARLIRDPDHLEVGWVLELPRDATLPTDGREGDDVVGVRAGDTLTDLARTHLGDAAAWPKLFAANVGHPQPDGAALTEPDLIRRGWALRLPPRASEGPRAPEATPSPDASAAPPTSAVTAPPTPPPPRAPRPTVPSPPRDPQQSRDRDRSPAPLVRPTDPHPGVELPSGSVVGLGLATALSACLAVIRLRQRARRRPRSPAAGIRYHDPLVTSTVARLHEAASCTTAPVTDDGRATSSPDGPTELACGFVALGRNETSEVVLDLLGGPADLDGPGGADVLRALLAAVLAPTESDEVRVLVAGEALGHSLLPPTEMGGVQVARDLASVLGRLEVETIRRTRLLAEADSEDFRAFTAAHPEDPLPLLVVVTEPPPERLAARFAAVAAPAARLGIAVVVLGRSGQPRRLHVDDGGRATASDGLGELGDAACYRLTDAEAAEVAAVIAAARRDIDVPEAAVLAEPFEAPTPRTRRAVVEVTVLGPDDVRACGAVVRTGLRSKARQLLAYLAVHPKGVTWEAAVDDIWGDATEPKRAYRQLRTNLNNIRSLRDALGDAEGMVVLRVGDRYLLNPEVVDCDLWRFEAALADAAAASDDETAIEALGRSVAAYGGAFCEGSYYRHWVEPIRQDLRGRAGDASIRLAELQVARSGRDAAVEMLERALRVDPLAQKACGRLIALYGALGRIDAARRAYDRLERDLAYIGREPDPATTGALQDALAARSDDDG